VGAGPLPRVGPPTDHPPRPPIPIVPVDDEAMAAARARGADDLTAWLAGVTGAPRPVVRVRTIGASSILESGGAKPALSVTEVAAAVDAGRDMAAAAAAEGITVLIASASAADAPTPALALIAALADDPAHPLGALRRLGDREIAVLCGIALGAGERGLGCVCDGLAALAGGAVAAAIEPTLRPRLRAVDAHEQAARLGIASVDAQELAAALDQARTRRALPG
jgi:nicotinate-nucleotide--dimethylbenzimidazole phosphoribosyltransferase